MDAGVAAMFADRNKRKDLFNMWLSHAQDFGKCEVEITRTNSQKRSAQATTVTWSRTQIEQTNRYSKEEIDQLIDTCTREGRYMDDPNFPGKVHLRKYFVIDEISSTRQHVQEDQQKLSNSGTITSNEALNLTSEGHTSWGQIDQHVLKLGSNSHPATIFFLNHPITPQNFWVSENHISFHATFPGADFSMAGAPTFGDVLGQPDAAVAPPVAGGGKGTGKKGKSKRKGKGETPPQNPPNVGGDDPPQPDPVKETTPLQKAKVLARSVFLTLIESSHF